MYLISDYFSCVAGNTAHGTVHKHATFRGSPHIYSRRTITLTTTNNQYIVDFDVFHGFVERTKKNVRIQTQFGEIHLQMFFFFMYLFVFSVKEIWVKAFFCLPVVPGNDGRVRHLRFCLETLMFFIVMVLASADDSESMTQPDDTNCSV